MQDDIMPDISSELLRALTIGQGFVALIDNRARIIWANDTLAAKHNVSSIYLKGRPFSSLLDPNLADLAQEILITALNEGVFYGELLMSGSHGSFPAQVFVSSIPPITKGGDFKILFIAHDRTSVKPMEEEARKRREFLSTMIRRAPLGIFCLDLNGEITIINDLMNEMASRIGITMKTGDYIFNLRDILNPDLIAVIETVLKGKQVDFGDVPLLADKYSRLIVHMMGTPLVSPEGKIEGAMIIFEDRTEKYRIAEKLREADRLASLGVLAANIAHEVNNPLTGILGILEVLKNQAKQKGIDDEPFERISSNLDRIKNIVRGLLDFSRKKIGITKDFDVNEVIERTMSFFRMQPRFKSILLKSELNRYIPLIKGDPSQIEQVLQDLIINSAQAIGDEGQIIISTNEDKSSREVIIRVKDTGCGIPPENLEKIFEPFFTTKEAEQGTGLGLAVCQTIVNQHGGSIYVEETSSNGTTFAIRLPFATTNND